MEFHDHIWNHQFPIFIETNTDIPGIGSLIREIAIKTSEMLESKHNCAPKCKGVSCIRVSNE